MGQEQDLALLIKSGTPLIVIETEEELRAIELFRHALSQALRPLYQWSITSGLKRLDIDVAEFGAAPADPKDILRQVAGNAEPSIYLLLDFHPYLKDPQTTRKLREISLGHFGVEHTVVLISPTLDLPDELKGHAALMELHLPSSEALDQMVREEAFDWSRRNAGQRVKISRKALGLLIQNLRGLTLQDARQLARSAIFNDGAITSQDVRRVMEEKFGLLNRGGVLSYEYELVGFDDIAGLVTMKKWISDRRPVFLSDDNPYGLDPPKGVLLLGVQGCGKSMAAKAVASGFGVPLLRLDFGAIYNKYHGETEKNLRQSLNSAEVMEPCVLWVDEIEKGLSVSDSDSGTSKRVLGTLLTWMAERNSKVFLVATANDIESLPPELVRKGRFDEIFFVDLPKPQVRSKIFEIHLQKRKQDPAEFDLEQLTLHSDGFSGAEIEQAVVAGLYSAMADGESLSTEDLVESLRSTRPLSVVMAERIAYLRDWARPRTVNAD
ncbi:MAG: AAA family ATPase [Xanthomonadales bacterium]|nr:AAA family ATPase [Xanthomonadales bacterium]